MLDPHAKNRATVLQASKLMKSYILILVAFALCVASGCAKKEQVDTVKLEASFNTAEPSTKGEVDKAVAAIKQQDWAGATASLQRLGADAKLTEDQKKAVKDTLEDVGKVIKDTAQKAVDGAGKALEDAQKSLGK
jgi:hypothetical protein